MFKSDWDHNVWYNNDFLIDRVAEIKNIIIIIKTIKDSERADLCIKNPICTIIIQFKNRISTTDIS